MGSGAYSELRIRLVILDSLGLGLFILPNLATPKLDILMIGVFKNPTTLF